MTQKHLKHGAAMVLRLNRTKLTRLFSLLTAVKQSTAHLDGQSKGQSKATFIVTVTS